MSNTEDVIAIKHSCGHTATYFVGTAHPAPTAVCEPCRNGTVRQFIDEARQLNYDGEPFGEKPPLGIVPRRIWLRSRLQALFEAAARYSIADKTVPKEWITEIVQISGELSPNE